LSDADSSTSEALPALRSSPRTVEDLSSLNDSVKKT
jgi:hypothetical protein